MSSPVIRGMNSLFFVADFTSIWKKHEPVNKENSAAVPL